MKPDASQAGSPGPLKLDRKEVRQILAKTDDWPLLLKHAWPWRIRRHSRGAL